MDCNKMAQRGQKGKYDTHVKPRLSDIENWCRDGLIDKEISKRLGVSIDSFNNYKKEYAELLESIKTGKQEADYRVENALYNRAIGYEYVEKKVIVEIPIVKVVPYEVIVYKDKIIYKDKIVYRDDTLPPETRYVYVNRKDPKANFHVHTLYVNYKTHDFP